jgi:hypothetical protein
MLDNAVLCVLCGYDLRTGQKLETQQVPLPAAAPQVTLKSRDWKGEAEEEEKASRKKRRRSRGGELPQAVLFLRGLAVAFACALIGSFMWFGLAYLLDIEMAIVAWVLGGLAGLGMRIGYGVEDVLAGLAAAGVALVAIFVAKVMILAAFLGNPAHFMEEATFDEEAAKAEMEAAMEEAAAELEPAAADFDEEMAGQGALEEGGAAGEQMPKEGLGEEEVAGEEAFDEGLPEDGEELVESGMPLGILVVAALIAGVLSMFFPLWNILYLVFACGTAYAVGSGGDWFGE